MAGRPKEFDPDEALVAATKLFWSHGFESTSMSMLVEEMGINRQSVYDTYGDKQSLYMDALRRYADQAAATFAEILTTGSSPICRIRKFLRTIAERACTGERRGCLMTNAIVEAAPDAAEARAFAKSGLKRLEELLTKTFKEAAAAGELAPGAKPAHLAKFVLTVMQGTIVLSKADMSSVEDALAIAERALTGK